LAQLSRSVYVRNSITFVGLRRPEGVRPKQAFVGAQWNLVKGGL
jgi:hypothetical protein